MLDWDSDSGTHIFIPYTLYCFKPTLLWVSLCVASSFFRADSNHPTTPVGFLLSRSIDEMKRLEEMSGMFRSSGVERHPPEPKSQTEGIEDSGGKEQPWEMVMDKKHFKLWRRPISGTHLYQYRGEPGPAGGVCRPFRSVPVLSRESCPVCCWHLLPDDESLLVCVTLCHRLSLSYIVAPVWRLVSESAFKQTEKETQMYRTVF